MFLTFLTDSKKLLNMNVYAIPKLTDTCHHKVLSILFNHKNIIRSFIEFGTAEERKHIIKSKISLLDLPKD